MEATSAGISGGLRGTAVWLNAMLAKQATQAIHFMVQPLDLCDDRLDAPATCQQVLQPQLADAQFPFPVAQCRCTVDVARLERASFCRRT